MTPSTYVSVLHSPMPPPSSPPLDHLLDRLAQALAQWVQPRIGLVDAISRQPSPSDHYGQTCAALALCSPIPSLSGKRDAALLAWLETPDGQIGHKPFNRLALSLMLTLHGGEFDSATQTMARTGISRCRLRKHYPSNNWTLLAATCELIEAPVQDRSRHARNLATMLRRWTTTKGAFIDFPANPNGTICTPTAYHQKALFLGALALRFCADDELARQTQRLFDWLVHCWDEAGYAGGFGRSTHALFGDGCLIAALILLGIDECGPIDRIARRLLQQLRPDGFLWLDPWGPTEGTRHWDDYMHLSVYNAWAAAMIPAARLLRDRYPLAPQLQALEWRANRAGLFHDEEAGLASWRDGAGNVLLMSTAGQPPQSVSRGHADLRYAGGRIYHLRIGSSPAILHPGYRGNLSDLCANPKLADETPLLQTGSLLCAIDSYQVDAVTSTSGGFSLALQGRAHNLTPSAPTSVVGRIISAIDWRFLNGRLGRIKNLRRAPVATLSADRTIELTSGGSLLKVTQELHLPLSSYDQCVHPPPAHLMRLHEGQKETSHGRTIKSYVYRQEDTYDIANGSPVAPITRGVQAY